MKLRANPYCSAGAWYFHDEAVHIHGPYPTQVEALRGLLEYMYYLENGPTLCQKLWWPLRYRLWPLIKELWHDDPRRKNQGPRDKGPFNTVY